MMPTADLSPGRYLAMVPPRSFVRVQDLPGTRQAAASALSRAAARGEVVRVRKGLYFKGVATRYGVATPASVDVARAVLGDEGVGPAGYSAARAFGLTTQVPPRTELAVAGPLPAPLEDVRLHRRNNMARRRLTWFEIALLEVLRAWDTVSDKPLSDLADAVSTAVRAGKLNLASVADVLRTERSPAARDRFEALSAILSEPVRAA